MVESESLLLHNKVFVLINTFLQQLLYFEPGLGFGRPKPVFPRAVGKTWQNLFFPGFGWYLLPKTGKNRIYFMMLHLGDEYCITASFNNAIISN